jgi:4-amino-4-deoxy-L-arabinose transferase-like glycosyltransferase
MANRISHGDLTMRATATGTLEADRSRSTAAELGWASRFRWLELLGLAGVLVVATVLDFFDLGREGFANTYYAAAVRSMATNWHNFFFSSFDPGGFVTIDKPPVGFWSQVLSVKLFGFHGVSLLLPEALAGVLSVVLVFYLVRRRFGGIAGLLAALALAVTPISVATNRNNTIDSLLALVLLLAAWSATVAVERGQLRWLVLCMALVGVGFNIKMAEAFVALPAFVLVYFLATPHSWRARILHLALAGMVLVVVSLSWVMTVDLIPAHDRPYVGSSQHDSELELALGYNGINRLFPRRLFRGVQPPRAATPAAPGSGQAASATDAVPRTPPAGFAGPGFGGASSGLPTVLRLFTPQLAGQLSWLIPLAGFGLLAAAWQTRLRRPVDDRQRAVLLWGAWFLSGVLLFTFDQAARPYYMVTLAPATAALVGLGVGALWHDYRRHALRGWLLPVALVSTAIVEILILRPFPTWSTWMTPSIAVLAGLAAIILTVTRVLPSRRNLTFAAMGAATAGVLCLFLGPAVWSGVTVARAAPGSIPSAGPAPAGPGFFGAGRSTTTNRRTTPARPDAQSSVDPALVNYLQTNRGDARFLVATPNAQSAAPIILKTDAPVMALGGFIGSDPILTPESLAATVKSNEVRFFLIPDPSATTTRATPGTAGGERSTRAESPGNEAVRQPGGFDGFFGRGNALSTWVSAHCTPVPADAWRSTSIAAPAAGFGFGFGGSQQLYDCAGATG